MGTTISIDRRTKEFLARQKRSLEAREGSQLTWDEFFERAFPAVKAPELSRKEVEELKKLVREGRPWRTRA